MVAVNKAKSAKEMAGNTAAGEPKIFLVDSEGKMMISLESDSVAAAIKAVTDLIPDDGAMSSLAQDSTVAKEASLAALVQDIADVRAEIEVVEVHLHSRTRWLGSVPGWDGLDEVNSASNDSLDLFTLISGDDTWGVPLCVIGSGDTPVIEGKAKFDPHSISVQATSDDAPMRIRFAWGVSYAAAIIAESFSEVSVVPRDFKVIGGPFEFIAPRLNAGVKMFASVWAKDVDAKTISFTIGLHEYDI